MPPMARNTNSVKLAVEWEANAGAYLGELSNTQSLILFISDLCHYWNLESSSSYALQFTQPPEYYVTEKTRSRVENGTVLRLVLSAPKMVEEILKKLNKANIVEKKEALEKLCKMSSDFTFAEEYINSRGLQMLISGIEQGSFDTPLLASALTAFLELMDHSIISWDTTPLTFIQKVAYFITMQLPIDGRLLSSALTILENYVVNSHDNYSAIEKEITLPHLMGHITKTKNIEVQQYVLSLMNALFQKSQANMKKYYVVTLSSRQYRTVISDNIIGQVQPSDMPAEMAHQLYVLQQLLLNQYEEKMQMPCDPNDSDTLDKLKSLRSVAFEFDVEGTNRSSSQEIKRENKRLGFKNDANPLQDLEVPPGVLALDNMFYFAKHHCDDYAKLVLENCYRLDSHECPFARSSIELTKLLSDLLHIGTAPTEQGQKYQPMLFTHSQAFEELFCICIVLLNKTWKEMKATLEDFSKVISVVKDQIRRTMERQPSTLENFYEKINTLTYAEIAELWQQERLSNEQQEMQAPPILELRKQLEPEMWELIQQHRLKFLMDGTLFKHSRGSRAKDKFRYCRLSPNHKFLHYDDCDEKSTPSIDELSKKISIVDIKDILTGKACPHMKDKAGRKNPHAYAFSLLLESVNVNENRTLDFIATDEMTFDYWVDGVHTLLRQSMMSPSALKELDMLLGMEIKLRLLDAEGVTIPHQPPPIPDPPPNYNFCF